MSYNFGKEFKKNLILENIKEELEQKDQRIKVLERAVENACCTIRQYAVMCFGDRAMKVNDIVEHTIGQAQFELDNKVDNTHFVEEVNALERKGDKK